MIVLGAVALTQSVGLDRFSMKDLASSLEAGEMSIYHHVSTRVELDRLVVGHIAATFDLPPGPVSSGRAAWLLAVAQEMRRALDEYPGVAQYLLVHGPTGALLATMERIMGVMEDGGVDRARIFRTYSIYVSTIISLCVQRTGWNRATDTGDPLALLREEFRAGPPGLAFVVDQLGGDPDEFFDEAISALLHGLELGR